MSIWTVGDTQEYSNGFTAEVAYENGHYAVLKKNRDERDDNWIEGNSNYVIAYAERKDRGGGDFPWCFIDGDEMGIEIIYSNITLAVANVIRLIEEGKKN